jgi:hypothetical protein
MFGNRRCEDANAPAKLDFNLRYGASVEASASLGEVLEPVEETRFDAKEVR